VAAGLLFLAAFSAAPASAQTGGEMSVNATEVSATETRNKSLVREAFTAWRNGTGSPFDLLADDAEWTIVGRSDASRKYSSREAFMREVIRPFNTRMRAPLQPKIRSIYADGETVIVFFDAGGVASDGLRYDNTYAWFMEFEDGRIVKAHAFFDSIAFNDLWRRVRPTTGK
jgi:uncharacterized protein